MRNIQAKKDQAISALVSIINRAYLVLQFPVHFYIISRIRDLYNRMNGLGAPRYPRREQRRIRARNDFFS